MAGEVENCGVGTFQTGLATAINQTFSYANNSLFYAIIPAYYRDYAIRYIRPACEWMDGYVPSIHNAGTGIVSTRIASKLITGITRQIVGEQLVFKLNSNRDDDALKTLQFITKWAKDKNIIKAVYSGIGYASAIGTSLIKINKNANQELWWEAVRMDNCFYLASFQNEVQEATFLIRTYTDTREGKTTAQYFLTEHRFYQVYEQGQIEEGTYQVLHKKGDRIPMVEYQVHRTTGTTNNNLLAVNLGKTSINWQEIPKDIQRMIKQDFGIICRKDGRINEPQELGLTNLGVVALLNGETDLSIPTASNFGESMLVGIQDDLITYELASSYLIRDMYYGKGTLYMPKSMSMADLSPYDTGIFPQSALNSAPNGPIELLKGVNPEEQKAFTEQFALRAQEWQLIKENCLKNIAVKWGMSPKILSSFLAQGVGQMTATQIDSEDDISIAYINLARSYYKNALNFLLETTLNFYGYAANIDLEFASPSLLNKDRLLDRTTKMRELGLIDLEEAVRIMNPDLDEEGLQAKIEIAKKEESKNLLDELTEMNEMGEFGNNLGDLGGANLKGTTIPRQ